MTTAANKPSRASVPSSSKAQRLPTQLLGALLVLHVAVVLGTAGVQGVPWDEPIQREYGEAVVQWYTSGFSDQSALEIFNLKFYGGTVEAGLELLVDVVGGDPYVVRHVFVGLLTTVGLLGIFLLGSQMGGAWVGLGSALILVLSPRFVGHGFFNSKDIPVAVFYLWSLIFLVRELRGDPKRGLRSVLPLGIALGLLLGTRIGMGIIMLPMVAGYVAAALLGGNARSTALRYLARFSVASLIAWGVMLIGWPWAQQSPVLAPVTSLVASSWFPWEHTELFRGEFVSSLSLPWKYTLIWFAQTLPEITLIGLALLAVGAVATRLRLLRTDPGALAVALAAVVPVAWIVATRTPLYDGVRHLLFIQPLLALGAALGFAWLGARLPVRKVRWLLIGAALVCTEPLVEMIRLHPYEYVYFNRVSGGVPDASGRMELDYWGLSYREGAEWMAANIPNIETARIASCSRPESTSLFLPNPTLYVGSYFDENRPMRGTPDFVLYTAAQDCDPWIPAGAPVHTITRKGVTLLHIVSR